MFPIKAHQTFALPKSTNASMPRVLLLANFEIVSGCQLRCVGCPNSVLQPKVQRISVSDFAACLANIDVKAIHTFRLFLFGEALLHRELPALLRQMVGWLRCATGYWWVRAAGRHSAFCPFTRKY